MGLLRRRKEDDTPPKPRAVVASALPLSGPEGKQAWKASASDVQWQKQAWYYYDAIGELHFAFQWLAKALSRAVLFAAETDPETGQITGPTEDPRAQKAALAVLGGPKHLPRLLSLVALQWQVSGETYILIVPQPPKKGVAQPDRWEVVTRNSLREQGGTWSFKDPLTGVWTKLREGTDRVIRAWEPHPDEQTHADCAMRSAIPICSEIEKSSQNIASRLVSRLASNGIIWLPQEIDFPVGEGEQADSASFMKLIYDAMLANIASPGDASAHVPIAVQVPGEYISALADAHTDFATDLDAAVPELRESAITRLGRTLDMSREIALGQVSDANHWTAWALEEMTYKVHLQPLLLRLGMTLTTEYFHELLAAMGEPDPSRFVLNWNVSDVVARPDDREDLRWAWEQNLVSADYVLSELGIPDDARPSEEEQRKQLARLLVTGAPTLLENPSVAAELGFEASVPQDAPTAVPAAPGEQPAPRALPDRGTEPDAALVASAELVVFDALSRAGSRLLTREYRGAFQAADRWTLHTHIPTAGRVDALLEGSFQFTERIAEAHGLDHADFGRAVSGYVRQRLISQSLHDRGDLAVWLRTVKRDDAA